ncbi:hypothetical protein NIES4102_31610 [Chondrocystis sp. NIES-4102]|nr:hypothetical protein NIES4102_31610 [Chondrocystis sp. NIES-4102]
MAIISKTRIFKQLENWLSKYGLSLPWDTKESSQLPVSKRWQPELPNQLSQQLLDAIANLPNHPANIQSIQATLENTFDIWRKNPNSISNSVVILSSPVTAVSSILAQTLTAWAEEKQVIVNILPLTARPIVENIDSQLRQHLSSHPQNSDSQTIEVIVIPDLGWCFLRSLSGFAGIEYLESLLNEENNNRFWIIGSGQVGWEYLKSVSNIAGYCGEVLTLPAIDPEELDAWFSPIIKEFNISFNNSNIDQELSSSDQDNRTKYFKQLNEISQGISTVAVQGFIQSINYQKIEEQDSNLECESGYIIADKPELPDLPDLNLKEQYLLYSLLLHGEHTMKTLAESLGDPVLEVHPIVQKLRSKGIIDQQQKILKVNPIHYPKLQQELARNNFLINTQ